MYGKSWSMLIRIMISIIIIITPVRPHKHDQAGGHGPALFWPLKLRRFRVHILPTTPLLSSLQSYNGT